MIYCDEHHQNYIKHKCIATTDGTCLSAQRLGRLRQEDPRFEASLSNLARLWWLTLGVNLTGLRDTGSCKHISGNICVVFLKTLVLEQWSEWGRLALDVGGDQPVS